MKSEKITIRKPVFITMAVLYIAIIVLGLVLTLFMNIFSCSVITRFGLPVYLRRITHLHLDSYYALQQQYGLYSTVTKIGDAEKGTNRIRILPPGRRRVASSRKSPAGSGTSWTI